MFASEVIPNVYQVASTRGVSLDCGYFQLSDDSWFVKNPESDAGIRLTSQGEYLEYWQGDDDKDVLASLREAGLNPQHVKF